jgi:hypothetical protein
VTAAEKAGLAARDRFEELARTIATAEASIAGCRARIAEVDADLVRLRPIIVEGHREAADAEFDRIAAAWIVVVEALAPVIAKAKAWSAAAGAQFFINEPWTVVPLPGSKLDGAGFLEAVKVPSLGSARVYPYLLDATTIETDREAAFPALDASRELLHALGRIAEPPAPKPAEPEQPPGTTRHISAKMWPGGTPPHWDDPEYFNRPKPEPAKEAA